MGSSDEWIVMLPFMAHGHLNPFLGLARKLHKMTGFSIAIASTPLNLHYLRSAISNEPHPGIRLAQLPFQSSDYGLPPNIESTENLPLAQIGEFFCATTNLETPFRDLLLDMIETEKKAPLCVISDTFFGWAGRVAEAVGTLNVSFTTGGAYGTLAYTSLWLNLPHRKTDSEEFSLPGFPQHCRFHVSQLHRFLRNADGSDAWSKFMQIQIANSLQAFGCLCNTVEEIEPLSLAWLRSYIKIPVWTVGPLLPPALLAKKPDQVSDLSSNRQGKRPGISVEKCLQWLDCKPPGSVLYISFGSQNTISPLQMIELAVGLEGSEVPFIWVIRPPIGFDLKGEFREEWLPEGFEERVSKSNRGLLVKQWAPQMEILCHQSTGAFLSHCGWNSVMESLSQGLKIIGWPMAAEQAYNCKMLVEEMGVCVELTRGVETQIEGRKVKEVIELVMDDAGKGQEMKMKAAEVAEQMKAAMLEDNGSTIRALNSFIEALLSQGTRPKLREV